MLTHEPFDFGKAMRIGFTSAYLPETMWSDIDGCPLIIFSRMLFLNHKFYHIAKFKGQIRSTKYKSDTLLGNSKLKGFCQNQHLSLLYRIGARSLGFPPLGPPLLTGTEMAECCTVVSQHTILIGSWATIVC